MYEHVTCDFLLQLDLMNSCLWGLPFVRACPTFLGGAKILIFPGELKGWDESTIDTMLSSQDSFYGTYTYRITYRCFPKWGQPKPLVSP